MILHPNRCPRGAWVSSLGLPPPRARIYPLAELVARTRARYSGSVDGLLALETLAVAVSAGVPVLLWGSPGMGKTSAVVALGETSDTKLPAGMCVVAARQPPDEAVVGLRPGRNGGVGDVRAVAVERRGRGVDCVRAFPVGRLVGPLLSVSRVQPCGWGGPFRRGRAKPPVGFRLARRRMGPSRGLEHLVASPWARRAGSYGLEGRPRQVRRSVLSAEGLREPGVPSASGRRRCRPSPRWSRARSACLARSPAASWRPSALPCRDGSAAA